MSGASITLRHAALVASSHDTLGRVHRQGYAWLRDTLAPAVRRLADGKQRRHRRLAARAYALVGDVHDLNGTPRAAVRSHHKALRLWPEYAPSWHAIGCMLDNMGRFKEARHALKRAAKLLPGDTLIAGELDRVEWAMLNPCPVLYEERSVLWRCAEELAAGRSKRALALIKRRRKVPARQLRARIHAVRGEIDAALDAWAMVGAGSGPVRLTHADWFYTFSGPVGDRADLWKLMLWKLRSRLQGGAFQFSDSLSEIDLPNQKKFELHVRCELARCEGDRRSLLALASTYPSWREPGEAALRLG